MKRKIQLLIIFIFLVAVYVIIQQKVIDFADGKGTYIDQNLPEMTPKVFAPGFITTDIGETCPAFSPDGKRFVFMRYDARKWDSGIKKYSTLMTE